MNTHDHYQIVALCCFAYDPRISSCSAVGDACYFSECPSSKRKFQRTNEHFYYQFFNNQRLYYQFDSYGLYSH